MLLRVLFSSRPVALRELGSGSKKKKKKRGGVEPGQLKEEEGAKYSLDNVRTGAQTRPHHGGPEEIVLKVTNFQQ